MKIYGKKRLTIVLFIAFEHLQGTQGGREVLRMSGKCLLCQKNVECGSTRRHQRYKGMQGQKVKHA